MRRHAVFAVVVCFIGAGICLGQPPVSPDASPAAASAPAVVRPGAVVHVESSPVERVRLYADGREIQVPSQTVVRPMCGSDPSKITRGELADIARTMREGFHPVQVVSPGRALRGAGLNVVYNVDGSVPAEAVTALEQVATYIESEFSDPVTVTVNVNFGNLNPNVIGATGSNYLEFTWPVARDGLMAGKDPTDTIQDFIPGGSTIPVRYVAGGSTTNEDRIFVTRANSKATLGAAGGTDASMTYNVNFSFDFDPSNGIGAGLTDFQSVAAHETGHAMGFTSGVDFRIGDIEMLDVFRFQRTANNPSTEAEFTTFARLADFDNPNDDHNSDLISVEYRMSDGDPFQASHFREQSPTIGVMDPAIAAGQTFAPDFFKTSDDAMFDAIGWDFPPVPSDITAPTPDPMTFAAVPAALSTSTITMTATTATDDTPPVQYFFEEFSGNPGANSSGWTIQTTYQDSGLAANTVYDYRVKARDGAAIPNETSFSDPAGIATFIQTPAGLGFSNVTGNSVDLTASGVFTNLNLGMSGLFFDSLTPGGDGGLNVWQQSTMATATGLMPGMQYEFRVKARNQDGLETPWSPTITVFTPVLIGDCDNDGELILAADMPCFVDALLGIEQVPGAIGRSDLNFDTLTNGQDVQWFVFCFTFGCN